MPAPRPALADAGSTYFGVVESVTCSGFTDLAGMGGQSQSYSSNNNDEWLSIGPDNCNVARSVLCIAY